MGLDNPKLMISLQAEVDTTAIYEGGAASVALTPLHPIIVRPRAIQSVIGVSKSEALRMEKTNPNFPKRVKIISFNFSNLDPYSADYKSAALPTELCGLCAYF